MFGLPLYSELLHGSALRTWNCVAYFVGSLWNKAIERLGGDTNNMPRSRRRHHSRSRTRSRSQSHDRDRDAKRRKVESFDSLPSNRRSVSSEPEANENVENAQIDCVELIDAHSHITTTSPTASQTTNEEGNDNNKIVEQECIQMSEETVKIAEEGKVSEANTQVDEGVMDVDKSEDEELKVQKETNEIPKPEESKEVVSTLVDENEELKTSSSEEEIKISEKDHPKPLLEQEIKDTDKREDEIKMPEVKAKIIEIAEENRSKTPEEEEVIDADKSQNEEMIDLDSTDESSDSEGSLSEKNVDHSLTNPIIASASAVKTPQKSLTLKQIQKKLESEKKRQERQREKDERERKKQEERDEKRRQKQEEKEVKDTKAKEEREAKQREKEIKDMEREQKRQKRQTEIDEKNREKQKIEEKKQKAAAAFTKFFVSNKQSKPVNDDVKKDEEAIVAAFMPFQVKSDMRLAPTTRCNLMRADKENLEKCMEEQNQVECHSYLQELRGNTFTIRRSGKTWGEEDVTIIEDDLGESILKQPGTKMKAKYLKFHENQRPGYFGTWRKTSTTITARKPFGQDEIFNYAIDSDEEWEDEEDGEDIARSDDEEKEVDSENDYEVDDEFFVPHGHLSDDEENDEEENISPEMRRAKEKMLKNQFDEERKSQTQRLKSRVLGCIWYDNNNENVDDAIAKYLQPYSIISSGTIRIKKRSDMVEINPKHKWHLDKELMPDLLRLVHGNIHSRKSLVAEFYEYLATNNVNVVVNKFGLSKLIKRIASWGKCAEEGAMFKKFCWLLSEDTKKEFKHVDVPLPNQWKYSCKNLFKAQVQDAESK